MLKYNEELEVTKVVYDNLHKHNETNGTFFYRIHNDKYFIKPAYTWALERINKVLSL